MEWNISVVLFCTLFWMVYECIIIVNANAVLTIFQLLCTYYHIYSSYYDMGPTLNSFSKWRDWVTKRKFLFQRIKVVNSNAKTDVQAVSRPVLLIYCTILPSHWLQPIQPFPQFIIFSDYFIVNSYFEGDIWARCLEWLMAGACWLFYEDQNFKRSILMNFLSVEIKAKPASVCSTCTQQSTHPDPYLNLMQWVCRQKSFLLC